MTTADIERRLSALERELARLRTRRPSAEKPHPVQALEQIHATFDNDEAFQEAMRLGCRWRQGERPGARKAKVKLIHILPNRARPISSASGT